MGIVEGGTEASGGDAAADGAVPVEQVEGEVVKDRDVLRGA